VSILWGGVENCPFPLTKPVAVNTGLEPGATAQPVMMMTWY